MKKKILSLLLAATMLMAALPLFGISSLAVEADAQSYDYDALYVSHGLQSLFTAYDMESGDSLDALKDVQGNAYTVTGSKASAVVGGLYLGAGSTLSASDVLPEIGVGESAFTYQVIFSLKDDALANKTAATESQFSWDGAYAARPVISVGAATVQVEPISTEAAANVIAAGSKYLPAHGFAGGVAKSYLQFFGAWHSDYDRTSIMPQLMSFAYDARSSLTIRGNATVSVREQDGGDDIVTYLGRLTGIFRNNAAVLTDGERVATNDAYTGDARDISIGNDKPMIVYSVRAYDRELTNSEIYQNHFADVAASFKLNMFYFDFLSEAGKAAVYTAFSGRSIDKLTSTSAQDLLDSTINAIPAAQRYDYNDLYVQDGLVGNLSFDSYTVEDVYEETSFDDGSGNVLAYFKKYSSAADDTPTWKFGNGFLQTGLNGTLDMSQLISASSGFTVQINMAHNSATKEDMFFAGDRSAIDTDKNGIASVKSLYVGPIRVAYQFSAKDVNGETGGVKSAQAHQWAYTKVGTTFDSETNTPVDVFGYKYVTNPPVWHSDTEKSEGTAGVVTGGFQGKLLASPLNVPFSISFTKDMNGTTGATVKAYRDTTNLKDVSIDYNVDEAQTNVLYVGAAVNMNLYAVRVYDRVLTDAEIKQNHFVDLASYLKISLAIFHSMTDAQKTAIYEKYANISYEDVADVEAAKATMETEIAKIVAGETPEALASLLVKFKGFQVSTNDTVAIRALYSLDKGVLDMLDGAATVSVGALYAPKGTKLDVTFGKDGAPAATKGATLTELYRASSLTGDTVFASETSLRFATSLSMTDYNAEYSFRAYIAITVGGKTTIAYCDTASDLFGDTVTATELATYFYNLGYTKGAVKTIYDAANK